jgi:hypothetical protein
MPDRLSKSEIGKDAVQSTVEAAAHTVGQVATIITRAVQDIAGAIGSFATEVYEIRDASRRAAEDLEAEEKPGSGDSVTDIGQETVTDPPPTGGDAVER